MRSKQEQIVRDLYDPNLKISENIRRIKADHPEIKYRDSTVRSILRAKRLGFKSSSNYLEHLVRRRGYKSLKDYSNHIIKNKGEFKSQSQYVKHREKIRIIKRLFEGNLDEIDRLLNKTSPDLVESISRIYEETKDNQDPEIEIVAPRRFRSVVDESVDFFETERKERMLSLLEESISSLPEEYAILIREKVYLGRKLREIGAKIGITRERVRQREEKALEKLVYIAKQNGLYQEYIQR